MAERVRASHVVATDDTVLPMLKVGKTHPARMWVYVGDAAHPYNVFDFTLRRSRDGPQEFLKNFTGVLLADAYGGYNGVVAGNGLTRAGCWSHARRKVIEAESTAMARRSSPCCAPCSRWNSRPGNFPSPSVYSGAKRSLSPCWRNCAGSYGWKEQLLPKHPMAEAVDYILGQWTELNVFCSDGAVPIDNNRSEQGDEARCTQSQEFSIRR